MGLASKRSANSTAFSKVRLVIIRPRTPFSTRCRISDSPMTPEPMTITVFSSSRSKIRLARSTATELTETGRLAMPVPCRTRFATEKERWKRRCRTLPTVPASWAME